MGTLPQHRHDDRPGATRSEPEDAFSRRAILAGTVATTAAAAVAPIAGSAYAAAPDVNSKQDMMAFLLLSAALTGVHVVNLAPEFTRDNSKDILDQDPAVDPINIKNAYFAWINANDSALSFGNLLQIVKDLAKDHRESATDIIAAVNAKDDNTKFLARSIVLLWYLGSWYKPEDLLKGNSTPGGRALIPSQVVSPKAYTQGLVWQIVGAHPMGYSNLQFGYWSRDPRDPNNPAEKSNFGLMSATIP
jgi:Membrane bound FAD containing D-sorbitol dehydrogenase